MNDELKEAAEVAAAAVVAEQVVDDDGPEHDMGDSGLLLDIVSRFIDKPKYAVEIGVHRGQLSDLVLSRWPELEYWMIDPWLAYDDASPYRKSGDVCSRFSSEAQAANMAAAVAVADRHPGPDNRSRAKVLRLTSVQASRYLTSLPPLDFAFIDGDHTYEAVVADIAAWMPKVRQNDPARPGVLAFHDYGHRRSLRGRWGVKRAVDELGERLGKIPQVLGTHAFFVL